MAVAKVRNKFNLPSPNQTLSSGITKVDPNTEVVTSLETYTSDGTIYKIAFKTTSLKANIPSDAALAFGQKLFTLPTGLLVPLGASLLVYSTAESGLSATAGEVGLGTALASGANATLGAVGATAEDIMEGSTIANHVAATQLTTEELNFQVGELASAAGGPTGTIDNTAGTTQCHFNIASTWNQTAAENVTFQVNGVLVLLLQASDYGVL